MQGGSEDQRRTFYSCLYRALLFPEKFYEFNVQGKPVHYSPYDGRLHDGVLYTDSGFWDTFRAAHPLYNLLFPEVSAEIQQSLVKYLPGKRLAARMARPGTPLDHDRPEFLLTLRRCVG